MDFSLLGSADSILSVAVPGLIILVGGSLLALLLESLLNAFGSKKDLRLSKWIIDQLPEKERRRILRKIKDECKRSSPTEGGTEPPNATTPPRP